VPHPGVEGFMTDMGPGLALAVIIIGSFAGGVIGVMVYIAIKAWPR
jgi:hypothetical protein